MLKYNYIRRHPLTMSELVSFCRDIKGRSLKESVKLGKKMGMAAHNVENLRQILGYSGTATNHKFTARKRDSIADEYRAGGCSVQGLARKYKVAYNTILCILKARGVKIVNDRMWTRRQEMFIVNETRRGTPVGDIAAMIGRSVGAIRSKLRKMEAVKKSR